MLQFRGNVPSWVVLSMTKDEIRRGKKQDKYNKRFIIAIIYVVSVHDLQL